MNQTLLALIVGLVAGAGGAFVVHTLHDGGGGAGSGDLDWAPIQERLANIEAQLTAQANPPESLATRTPSSRTGRVLNAEGDEVLEALIAKIDERVGKTIEKKLAEAREAEGEEGSVRRGRRHRGRKRVPLADAARELELTAQQEDDLRRIFEDTQTRFFKLMAGPDGDPEEVKREVLDAAGKPGGAQKLMPKYMPKLVANIGEIMAIQAEREAAVQKTLGPEKARRLKDEFSVEEDDLLGLRGGEMSIGVEARAGN